MRLEVRLIVGLLAGAWGLTACDGAYLNGAYINGPRTGVRRGLIEIESDPVTVVVPDSVQVGTTAIAIVTTFGGGCETLGPTDVTVLDLVAIVEPYDSTSPGAIGCTRQLKAFQHEAAVQFDRVGEALVIVVGWSEVLDTLLSLPYPVTVW